MFFVSAFNKLLAFIFFKISAKNKEAIFSIKTFHKLLLYPVASAKGPVKGNF